mmetsp:Transcript_28045/g.42969  ORF Transcript_28045/g.42969 Transcript_28045/m.42969 type:complete len:242 (+) Transcript_28045:85-810(+)
MGRSQVERNRRLGRPGNRSKKGSDSDADGRSGHVNKNTTHVVKNRNAWRHDNSTPPAPKKGAEATQQEFLESEVHSFTMAGGSYYVGDDDDKYNDDSNPPAFDKISRIFEQPQDIDNVSKTLSTMLVSERLRMPSYLTTTLEQLYPATMIGKDDNVQKKQQRQQQQPQHPQHPQRQHEQLNANVEQIETNNNSKSNNSSNNNNDDDAGHRDQVDNDNDNNEDDTEDEDNDELEDWLDSVIA